MKKIGFYWKKSFLFILSAFLSGAVLKAQESKKDDRLIDDSKNARVEFVKGDKLMDKLFSSSYAYVIFPNIGKGAAGVGGAAGNGIVYEKGKAIGSASMTQLTVGLQLGGKAYREVIFFENKEALDRFTGGKFEFAAQTSAVAVKSGISADAKYREGVMVYSQEKAGLMYEASVGGQKFSYKAF